MEKIICVYSASSSEIAPEFFDAARELGAEIARRGYALIYGGAKVGPMGTIAEAVHSNGGKVIGVIPERLRAAGIAFDLADELVVTKDMRERKAVMEERATAFVTLPGGFGTLEEFFEIVTLKQLGYHDKPVALLNVNGFYNPLQVLMEHIYEQRFAKPVYRQMYHMADDIPGLFRYLDAYQPPELGSKW